VPSLTRRGLIAGGVPLIGAAALVRSGSAGGHSMQAHNGHAGHDSGHANFRNGVAVDHAANGFDPHEIVRDFDWGTTSRVNGRVVREWELVAVDKEIEVMPGVKFAAWTYNGRIPGPTLRAREGERLRIRFANGSQHPHTIHFHGIHPA
jgi:FtsP/CotA-like multicopper oxidase with cupredoxin domain